MRSASLTSITQRTPASPEVVINVRGVIDDATRRSVVAVINAAGPRTRLCVRIDSPGGDIACATRIARALRSRRGETRGQVVGHCSSAALLVLAACKTSRFAGADARFLLHEAELIDRAPGRVTASHLRAEARLMEDADSGIARLLAAWTNGDKQTFGDLIAGDVEIGARRAVEIGLLTQVVGRPEWTRRQAASARRGPVDVPLFNEIAKWVLR